MSWDYPLCVISPGLFVAMAACIYVAHSHVRNVTGVGGISPRFLSRRGAKGCTKSSPGSGLVGTDLLLCDGVRNTPTKFAGSATFGRAINVFLEVRISLSETDRSTLVRGTSS